MSDNTDSKPASTTEAETGAEASKPSVATLLDTAAAADEEAEADFDEKAEKKDEEKSKGTCVFLRGKLKPAEDETVVYYGSWAVNKDDFADKTKTSKIRYETSLSRKQLVAGDLHETSWDGYFLVKQDEVQENGDPKYTKIKEEGIEFSVVSEPGSEVVKFKGNGVNAYGSFSLDGVYDRKSHRMMITKQYDGEDSDDELEDDARSAEEVAEELALLREDLSVDVSQLKSGEHLRKRKASGSAASAAAPIAKRERRQSAMRAQNRWRDEIAAAEGSTGSDSLQSLTDKVQKLRKTGTAQQLLPLLQKLEALSISVNDLMRTKVGVVVNKVAKKHSDAEVRRLSSPTCAIDENISSMLCVSVS